jgi:glycosyltransferase involved in cell wall biosynthesis
VRACAVIPTFDNPRTIRTVVERVRVHLDDVIVVDDGSGEDARAVIDGIERDGLARVHRRAKNGGKGAAVKDGLRRAHESGFSHALQIDADGQHETDDIPRLLAAAREQPAALVLAAPVFDASAPRSRLAGRRITQFWTNFETGGRIIEDPMCGFRVYPLAAATAVRVVGDHMDFDIEIAVRMVWHGAAVVNLPTRVRYLPAEAGGVSHFRMVRDNLRISWMHTRLVNLRLWRTLARWLRIRRA